MGCNPSYEALIEWDDPPSTKKMGNNHGFRSDNDLPVANRGFPSLPCFMTPGYPSGWDKVNSCRMSNASGEFLANGG